MLITLALRHLVVRKRRSLFLLFGFSLGVGVMIVLLSVGEAMLDQSRDVTLVGGGELTVLPQGIDVEAMRTGGLSGMYFGIDRARFLTRQVLGGARHSRVIASVSPVIEGKLLYLRHGNRTVAVRAGGEIPSRARAVGSGLDVRSGFWEDSPADSAYLLPTRQQLYDQLDHFHLPRRPDSAWGEWHYFNLVTAPDEWWYVSFLIGGQVKQGPMAASDGRLWGGQLLVTHRRADGRHQRFSLEVPSNSIQFDTARADLRLGESSVTQRNGIYQVRARVGSKNERVRIDFTLTPAPNRYFPPVELRAGEFISGYVVPALEAGASGTVCIGARCRKFLAAPAYHDHNWGIWRDVTWEWGAARGRELSLLYGGVYGPERGEATASPFFLTLVDSLGVKQVLRFNDIDYEGAPPARFSLTARRDADSIRLSVRVLDALTTGMGAGKFRRVFFQMRGRFTMEGRVLGQVVSDSGTGFFETYVTHAGQGSPGARQEFAPREK